MHLYTLYVKAHCGKQDGRQGECENRLRFGQFGFLVKYQKMTRYT